MKLSIVIPAYNEEETITKVIRDAHNVMKNSGISYEIIVVNDGSKDNTGALARKEYVVLINHPYNQGYGASLKTGIRNSKSKYVLIMDGDDQHYPDDILRIFEKAKDYEMVVGARTNITSFLRSPAKLILSFFANYLAGRKIPDLNSGFRIMKKDFVMNYMHILPNKFSFTTTITLCAVDGGHSFCYMPIKVKKRNTGKSTIHPVKDTTNFLLLLIRMTMLFNPLKVFIPTSLFLLIFGIAFSTYPKSASIIFVAAMLTFFFGLLADQVSLMRRER